MLGQKQILKPGPMQSRGGCMSLADNLGLSFINSCRAVESVLVRVSGWARLNKMAAFLRQNEIQNGIEDCHRELEACYNRFMVSWPYAT